MKAARLFSALLLCLVVYVPAAAQETRLLRRPTVSHEAVAFAWAGDLWVASRDGGTARRLTATPGVETDPRFSPDGSLIAFTATVAGNTDVYVVPVAGGDPTRLTYHPGLDVVRGWTPDGRRVVFGSARTSAPHQSYLRLWTVPVEGGLPEPMGPPRAYTGALSPDGRRLAYEEFSVAFQPQWAAGQLSQWRHYRGGRTHPILLMDLADHSVVRLPWEESNDTDPMWLGDTVYFLSDRNHTVNLFSYRPATNTLTQLTHHDDFDIMSASAGPDAIVYEQAGYIHRYDVATGNARRLPIEVTGDLAWARPQFRSVAGLIRNVALSPTGARIAVEARGEIFTVPAEKGDFRNLTQSTAVHERSPVWSPDGTRLAWLSDAGGEYQLMIGDPLGLDAPRAIALPSTAFFSAPAWSPDGAHIVLEDNHLNLWLIRVANGRATRIDAQTYEGLLARRFQPQWSPDSRWVAYSKVLPSHMRAIFVHSLADGRSYQVTDGLSDAIAPVFDASGKYLYFLASTDYALRSAWLNMSSLDRPVTRAIYLAVLAAGEPSPLLPESDEEPPATGPARATPDAAQARATPDAGSARAAPTAVPTVRIDIEGIGQRILAIDVPAGDYADLAAGPAGTLFYTAAGGGPGAGRRLHRYQLRERAASVFLEGIQSYTVSGDGKRLLYRAGGGQGGRWGVVPTDRPARVGDGAVDMAQLQVRVDPRAEWAHIFRETWRLQREFFYDPEMHGTDWAAVYEKYLPLVEHVGHRDDLSYLIATVGGELGVGHSYVSGGGDQPSDASVSVGLLGADLVVENGRYRIRRIYGGENWNPELRAPLSAPGIAVAEGDYLLEVNGRPLVPPANPYSLFEGTAGRQTMIRVNDRPSLDGSRLVTVVPIANEGGLRARAWIEGNRRLVDELSGGRLAYVWLPNTAGPGYTAFNRYFYAQQHKEGAIIDERYNQGGLVADYIVNELDRGLMGFFAQRAGEPTTSPMPGLYGPKVMIINESAGSGGDALPYYFRLRGIGPLVGTRTWGGLVGTTGIPPTLDGGGITAPSLAFYDLEGRWAVENEGVAPDIEVHYTPAEVLRGRDPQLERAVQEALRLLEQNPVQRLPRPAPPTDRTGPGAAGAPSGRPDDR